jgi:hypothetical protein
VHLPEGVRVFAVQRHRTSLLSSIPARQYKTFVLFPLPAGESQNDEYLTQVRARFSDGALHPQTAGGLTFLTGATTELHALFPTLSSASARLYTSLHAGSLAVYGR